MLVSVLALAGALIWSDYRSTYEAGELRARSSAHVVAASFQWIFETSNQTLRRLDLAMQQNNLAAIPDSIADIDEIVGDLPRGFQYATYDAGGNLTYSSVDDASRIRVEDRNYFRRLVNGEEQVISDQLDERLTGDKVFVIARRVTVLGEFAGAVSIAVPVSALEELWETMRLSPGSSLSLLRSDGMVVARYPALEGSTNASSSQVFEAIKESPEGSYFAESPLDGENRLVGYWQLDGWPVIATAALGPSDFLTPFWTRFRFWLLFGIPSLLVVAGLLMWLALLIRRDQGRSLQLAESLQRNEFLMREIHHRVKNNLQVVSSLVRLQKMPREEKESLTSRISAMVSIHEEVYKSDQFETITVSPYLTRLVTDISGAYGGQAEINYDFEEITLPGDRAMQLGLLLNELVSNSFKHGIKSEGGKLDISLKRIEDDQIELTVRDNGPGYEKDEATENMGSRLISAFVTQLGAEYEVANDNGAVARVRFKA